MNHIVQVLYHVRIAIQLSGTRLAMYVSMLNGLYQLKNNQHSGLLPNYDLPLA